MPVAAYRQDTYMYYAVFNVDFYYFPTDRNSAGFTTHQDMPVAAYRQDTYMYYAVFNVDFYYFPTDRNSAGFTPTKICQ